ncbi:MAG: GBS Bsp-like repeat-containing protein [bacterium]|nr:GBS Bsp-like repeat-containing protein [bacterium]
MTRIKTKHLFLFLFFAAIVIAGFLVIPKMVDEAKADSWSNSGSLFCEKRGSSTSCSIVRGIGYGEVNGQILPYQLFYASFSGTVDGHGAFGPAGGKGKIDACLSPDGAMWGGGACTQVEKIVGDEIVSFSGILDLRGDLAPGYNWFVSAIYVNDATLRGTFDLQSRLVEITSFTVPSDPQPQGENFDLRWDFEHLESGKLTYSGAGISCPSLPSGQQFSGSFPLGTTCSLSQSSGTATITIEATGATGNGLDTVSWTETVDATGPVIGNFILNNISCGGGSSPYVDIDWGASSNATDYEVQRKIWSGGSWGRLGSTTGTSYTDSSPVTDSDNYYRVIASNSTGTKTSSNSLSISVSAAGCGGSAPSAPVCTPSTQNAEVNEVVRLSASGGDGVYNWSAPNSSHPSSSTINIDISYSTAGTKTITLTSAGLSATCTVNVTPPGAAPSADLWITYNGTRYDSNFSVNSGDSVTVAWSSQNVSSCTVSPTGWTGTSNPGRPATISAPVTVTLDCDNGAATDSISISLNTVVPGVCTPNIPTTYVPGGTINASFSGTGFTGGYFPTWSTANGQDDLVWYPASGGGNTWSVSIPTSSHGPSTSNIAIHIYTNPGVVFCGGREVAPAASPGGGTLGFSISYAPDSGTLTVNSNISSSWTISGVGSRSGTSSTDTVGAGSYSIAPVSISGYSVSVSPSSTVSVSAAGFTTANINYALTPLNQPTISSVNNATCGQLTVNWSYTPNGVEQSFSVWRSTSAGSQGNQIASGLSAATRSYTDTTGAPNTSYWFIVKAHTSIGGSREAASGQTGPTLNLSCTANLNNSSKTLYSINGQAYSTSALIQNGDTLTFRVTINNAGPAAAQVNYICDYPSSNITNLRNLSVSGGGSAGSITPNSPTCGGGTLIGVSGAKPVGNPNWIVQFDTTFASQTEDQFEVCQNTANINFTDGTGTKTQGTNFGPFLCKTGKGSVPDFREVAP